MMADCGALRPVRTFLCICGGNSLPLQFPQHPVHYKYASTLNMLRRVTRETEINLLHLPDQDDLLDRVRMTHDVNFPKLKKGMEPWFQSGDHLYVVWLDATDPARVVERYEFTEVRMDLPPGDIGCMM